MTLVQNVNSPPPSNQVSESLQVRIVAGRPIHCQVPGIDHHLVRWAAVRATLEAAKAIALSHLGVLYIAETDERRINRIQQVMATDQSRHSASLPFVAAGKSCQDVAVVLFYSQPMRRCQLTFCLFKSPAVIFKGMQ